jgi:hypothetical protein
VVIPADRGSGRAEFAAARPELGFRWVVRIQLAVTVSCCRYHGAPSRYPTRKGMAHVRREVPYRKDAPVAHDIVVRWQPGWPEERDGPWYLMTDSGGRAEALRGLSGRRMSGAELFRGQESRRGGFAPRDTRVRRPERLDRLLRILALASILLVGPGPQARLDFDPSAWCTDRRARARERGAWRIGGARLPRTNDLPEHRLRGVRWATIQAA